MQVFSAFLKIFKKNLPGIIIYVSVFIAIAVGLSKYSQKEGPTNFVQTKLKIAVDNQDAGELGSALTDYLEKDNELKAVPESEEALLDSIYNREIDYVLYIPEHFTESFQNGQRSGLLDKKNVPSSLTGALADGQINQFLASIGMYLEGGFSLEEAMEYGAADYEKEAKVEFYSGLDNNKKEGGYYFFHYIPYIFICVCIVGLGPVFMAFRRKEIKDRNNCSAMTFLQRNQQMILGACVVGVIIYAIFIGASLLLYKDSMLSMRGAMSMINSVIFLLLAFCLTYVVSQIAKNENVINMVSNVLGLGFSFLGGVFVPLELMGETVTKVAKFMPSYWYVTNNEKIWDPSGAAVFSNEFAIGIFIQLTFTFVFLCIGLVINKLSMKTA